MSTNNEEPVIPPEELKCIWMEAGIVAYKLCDRKYECENCPLDLVFRGQRMEQPAVRALSLSERPAQEHVAESAATADEYFEQRLAAFLQPFLAPQLPDDRMYYRNHMWIKNDIGDVVRMGIDHLAVQMLGSVKGIVLPQTPSHINQDAPCAWLTHHDGAVALRAPMDGSIIYANKDMKECPFLIINYPYTEGWVLLLSPDAPADTKRNLLRNDDAAELYRMQGKHMHDQFIHAYERMRPRIGQTFHDGGTHIENLPQMIGDKAFYGIIDNIFQVF
jgi:glycine cleavage system H protein